MDEDILDAVVGTEDVLQGSGESGEVHQDGVEYPEVTADDTAADSVSGGDLQGDPGGTVDVPWADAYDDGLGGVPVVIVDAPETYAAVGTQSGYQMSTYYVDYFSGVLANLHDTDYLAFCTRENVSGSSYTEHNRLVYDINVVGGVAQTGVYPCIDIYRPSSSTVYTVSNTAYSLTVVPSFSYGSFGTFSDLRKEVGHSETYAILFFLGFFAVYSVCHDIFDYVMEHIYRK